MSKLTVKERINALQRTEQRPSTSLGLVDAQRRISNGSKNVKERAHYFQQTQSPAYTPSNYEFDTISNTSNSTSNHSIHSIHSTSDNTTPPSTNPPSSPRLLHVQTPSSSIRVENGSVTSESHADSTLTTLTPTPSSPAFTATTDVNFQVPELVETDLQHNQEIVQLLRNDKQLSFEEEGEESERDALSDIHVDAAATSTSTNHLSPTVSHSPPTQVIEATQDLANLSTSFSATPPAPTRSIYDDIDEDSGAEGGWATVIT
ncbi:hypothetical protein E3P99_00969 [Wallemia hederae]|uniref:Uncharacterized protein n=1 Tax=Wallemia hederae TaxID=1540922 RepID=A0A4T0FSQ8_9BASI|nr:hypothetical protein E3P99_00969 [Wallemia hederae]